MLTAAIAGLGKLKADIAAPLLIDELLDDNPETGAQAHGRWVNVVVKDALVDSLLDAFFSNS
jgi:hypothetical protein